jgi:uncharacterized protein YjbI with pentapeptide repeats
MAGRDRDVFPGLGSAATAGMLIGASFAGTAALLSKQGVPEVVATTILGLLVGVVIGILVPALVPATSAPRPAAPERPVLWDRWLDAEAVVLAATADAPTPAAPSPPPERAPVRPRVISPGSGEPMCLEEEVLGVLREGLRGAVRIAGGPGSGKTVALRHLRAVLPAELRVMVLDDPDPEVLARGAACGLVVHAAAASSSTKCLATFAMAPWGEDEQIEYLVAVAREQCGSVMTRLKATADRGWIGGSPELWRIVLDRMAADPTIASVRDALRRELAPRLSDDTVRRLVSGVCLGALMNRDAEAIAPSLREQLANCCPDRSLARLVAHRPVQLLVAADGILAELAAGQPCQFLGEPLPRELVQEAGARLGDNNAARDRLEAIVGGNGECLHAMAASLLHAASPGWRPAPTARPRLSKAYLDRAEWSGIDLACMELEGTSFTRALLSGARLEGVCAAHGLFRGASLRGASLKIASLLGADLSAADLREVHAEAVELSDAKLNGANLSGARLPKAQLHRADLSGATLVEADLSAADFSWAEIAGADFTGAVLERAGLRGLILNRSEFRNARFTGADLSRCNLEGMELDGAVFREAYLREALLTGSSCPGVDFQGACLRGAGLAEIAWENARLAGADLRRATFHMGTTRSGLVASPIACEGSRTGFYTDDFDEQDFKSPEEIRKANLCGADLRGARIDDVDFYLVDLRGARYDPDQAEHFRRCGAILADR